MCKLGKLCKNATVDFQFEGLNQKLYTNGAVIKTMLHESDSCWEHMTPDERENVLDYIMRCLEYIEKKPNGARLTKLVGINFDKRIASSHTRLYNMRLVFTDALLIQVTLSDVEANSSVFSGATLIDCNLSHSSFKEAFFREAKLVNVDAAGCDFSKSCWDRANVFFGDFSRCMFDRSDFRESKLSWISAEKSVFSATCFQSAKIGWRSPDVPVLKEILEKLGEDYNLLKTPPGIKIPINFSKSIFASADLSGVSLSDLQMEDAEFNKADLTGASLKNCTLSNAQFQWAQIRAGKTRPKFENCKLDTADFSRASLVGAHFVSDCMATMQDVSFQNANMRNTQFIGRPDSKLNMQRANFNSANLDGAKFLSVDLDSADFGGGASLKAAIFRSACGVNSPLSCNLVACRMNGATLDAARFFLLQLGWGEPRRHFCH